MMFACELPLPPSSNNLFATDFKTKRRFISKKYTVWKREASRALIDAWKAADRPIIGKPYALHIELNINHQSDVAGREKALVDLLVSSIPGFPDDRWANRILIERNRDIPAARVEVVTLTERAA